MGWGKTGPAHSFPPPKCFDLSIYLSVLWIMLLFHAIWTLMNELFQTEDEVFKPNSLLVLLHYRGRPILSPLQNVDLSIYLSVFRFMLFFYCIVWLMNDLFQRDNQIFKPKSLLRIPHPKCLSKWIDSSNEWAGERLSRFSFNPFK